MYNKPTINKIYYYTRNIQYTFNGSLYLVKDINVSDQYIGQGKTLSQAIADMKSTLKNIIKVKPFPAYV